MTPLIDISLPVHPDMVIWPKSRGVQWSWDLRIEREDLSNLTYVHADIHVGTHVEHGLHFLPDGAPIDAVPLDTWVGEAQVIDLPEASVIDDTVLEHARVLPTTHRLLFRTRNSQLWANGVREFDERFVGLNVAGAQWIAAHGIRLVGNDYLSIATFTESRTVHEALHNANVAILEGVALAHVTPGVYRLLCLPQHLVGREAAPARAVLEVL